MTKKEFPARPFFNHQAFFGLPEPRQKLTAEEVDENSSSFVNQLRDEIDKRLLEKAISKVLSVRDNTVNCLMAKFRN